jgi:hypothetical protein
MASGYLSHLSLVQTKGVHCAVTDKKYFLLSGYTIKLIKGGDAFPALISKIT